MCMLSKRNSNSKDMKRTILIMLAAFTMMTGASAQKTERTKAEVGGFYFGDAAKLDSMYNYWNNFVAQHPKDEIAWRNLFDVSESKVYQMLNQTMHSSERPKNLRTVEDYRALVREIYEGDLVIDNSVEKMPEVDVTLHVREGTIM